MYVEMRNLQGLHFDKRFTRTEGFIGTMAYIACILYSVVDKEVNKEFED
jgi:hypothetical protein